MAPESAFGQVVSRAMDIWAFGMLLYEMLTGGVLGNDLKTHVQRLYTGFTLELPDNMPELLKVRHHQRVPFCSCESCRDVFCAPFWGGVWFCRQAFIHSTQSQRNATTRRPGPFV